MGSESHRARGGIAVRRRRYDTETCARRRPLPASALTATTLDYGSADPLVLEAATGGEIVDCRGPEGVGGAAATRLVESAIDAPPQGPPLGAHVVAGDRVVVAVCGAVPQAGAVVAAVVARLAAAGIAAEDVRVLVAGPGEGEHAAPSAMVAGAAAFDPVSPTATAYLAADEAGRPLYLARDLVDADVVVAVGAWGWNAALGGRALAGELWPAFSRQECRRELTRSLARRGRHALPDWKSAVQEVAWQLGVCASLRLVPGRAGTLHAACFGLPDEAGRRAREAAAAWCPHVAAAADLVVASVSDPAGGFGVITRAVAAAARVVRPGGTICVASRVSTGPGVVFLRWRQGAPLEGLVHEAVATNDATLVAEALETRLFARGLGDNRLVLLSDIEEATVEELGFGHAAGPEVVERLAHRADRVVVLHEADLMLPRLG